MKKDISVSVIRLFAMLMIIGCHILQGLNNKWAFWVNVGVQIFFFISGFLYGKKDIDNIKTFYVGRLKKILLPYVTLLTIVLIIEKIFLKSHYSLTLLVGSYLGFGGFNGNSPILSHTWFLSYILFCYLLTPIFQKILSNDNFKKDSFYFIFLIIFLQLLQEFHVLEINVSWINNYLIGYFYSRCCKNIKDQKKTELAFILVSFLIIPFAIIYQENINISAFIPNIITNHSILIMQYGHVLLGTLIFILFYKLLNHCSIKNNVILQYSDKYSFYIYLVHQIFILNSFSILFLTKYLLINIILIFLLSFFTGMLLKYLNDGILKLKILHRL